MGYVIPGQAYFHHCPPFAGSNPAKAAIATYCRVGPCKAGKRYGGAMSRTTQQLIDIGYQISDLEKDLAQSQEQYEAMDDMAEDAHIRALVSESPMQDQNAHEMLVAKERLHSVIESMTREIALLKVKQEQLVEKLYEESSDVDDNDHNV